MPVTSTAGRASAVPSDVILPIARSSSGAPRRAGGAPAGELAPVVGTATGVEADLGGRGDVDHVVHLPVPGPGRPVRAICLAASQVAQGRSSQAKLGESA